MPSESTSAFLVNVKTCESLSKFEIMPSPSAEAFNADNPFTLGNFTVTTFESSNNFCK